MLERTLQSAARLANGKLFVIEAVIPPANQPFFHKFMDLNILVMTGGRERTEAEYRALFEAAGLHLNHIIATPTELAILEGVQRTGS